MLDQYNPTETVEQTKERIFGRFDCGETVRNVMNSELRVRPTDIWIFHDEWRKDARRRIDSIIDEVVKVEQVRERLKGNSTPDSVARAVKARVYSDLEKLINTTLSSR